jgi:hypothetical protein
MLLFVTLLLVTLPFVTLPFVTMLLGPRPRARRKRCSQPSAAAPS